MIDDHTDSNRTRAPLSQCAHYNCTLQREHIPLTLMQAHPYRTHPNMSAPSTRTHPHPKGLRGFRAKEEREGKVRNPLNDGQRT